MRIKEYLHQAYRLDHRINSDIEEMARLRDMASSVSAPMFGDKVQISRSNEAPYVRCIEKILTLEKRINDEIDTLVDLKEQIRGTIDKVTDTDERMVLRYRYVHNYTWEQIGDELNADKSTVRRWHGNALLHAEVPENPIVI